MGKNKFLWVLSWIVIAKLYSQEDPHMSYDHTCQCECHHFEDSCHSNWYIGASYELLNDFTYQSSDKQYVELANVRVVETTMQDLKNPGMGYQIFLGYTVNRYLAVEGKYAQIVIPNKVETFTQNLPNILGTTTSVTQKEYRIMFGPFCIFNIPLSEYFTPYFKGGLCTFYTKIKQTYDQEQVDTPPTTEDFYQRAWSENFVMGFGFKMKVASILGIRVELEFPLNSTLYIGGNTIIDIPGDFNIAGYFEF